MAFKKPIHFGGGPNNLVVGGNANLMIQDTWYEGNSSRYVTCQENDAANITVETSMLSMGGWHGATASSQTTFNVDTCATQTTVIASDLGRSGFEGIAPTPSLILPATSTSETQVLFLNNNEFNTTPDAFVPMNFSGVLDQATFVVDPATRAQYANLMGAFWQNFATPDNPNPSGANQKYFAAKQMGKLDVSFIRSMLSQAMDPRLTSASTFVPPIMDPESSDIQMLRVSVGGSRFDAQFVLAGNPGQ